MTECAAISHGAWYCLFTSLLSPGTENQHSTNCIMVKNVVSFQKICICRWYDGLSIFNLFWQVDRIIQFTKLFSKFLLNVFKTYLAKLFGHNFYSIMTGQGWDDTIHQCGITQSQDIPAAPNSHSSHSTTARLCYEQVRSCDWQLSIRFLKRTLKEKFNNFVNNRNNVSMNLHKKNSICWFLAPFSNTVVFGKHKIQTEVFEIIHVADIKVYLTLIA